MANPLTIHIVPPQVEPSKRSSTGSALKLDQKKKVPERKSYKGVSAPLMPAPSLLAIFEQTVQQHEVAVKTGIEKGTLDRHGNPLGTVYWDPDAQNPTRKRVVTNRRRKLTVKIGQIFGDLTVLRKGPRIKAARPNLQERWRCQCTCGKQLIVPKYYLTRQPNPKTHCGCKTATIKSLNPREYRIYMMIHVRLYNKNHVSYAHYNERGITLYPEWHKDKPNGFKKFLEHVTTPPVGPCPTIRHSLDRINNNKGYEPGNLRWATAKEQRANQGDLIGGLTSEEIADLGYTEDEYIEKLIAGEIA